jgi:protein phosphatase
MLGIAGRVALVLLILAVGLIGVRVYVDRQWYVGESGDRVAVFRGVPAEFAGLHFSHPVVITDIPAAQAEAVSFYSGLADGLSANDRDGALAIVEQIRRDVEAAASGGGGGAAAP